MGFGLLNFFCAFPAVWWIDLFSRRSLLLATFPVIAIFQFAVAFGFEAMGRALKALVVTFSYAFAIAYSVGEGPAPFVSHLNQQFMQLSELYSRHMHLKLYLYTVATSVSPPSAVP